MPEVYTPVKTDYFFDDGRGPILKHWLYDTDFVLPNSPEKATRPNIILGADYGHWVVFHRMQVIQIVPEEVYGYKYLDHTQEKGNGAWLVEDSNWLKSFHPRHLANAKHFILIFYDEIVEVICNDLIFGEGPFDIEAIAAVDGRFAYVYYARSDLARKLGNKGEEIFYLKKYIEMKVIETESDRMSVSGAKRTIHYLENS